MRRNLLAVGPCIGSFFVLAACGGAELPPAEAPAAELSSAPAPAAPTPSAQAAEAKPTGPCASPTACRELAKGAKDGDEKSAHLGRACDLGDGEACTEAAQALVDRPVRTSGKEIVPWLEKGCAAKAGSACNGLGQLFHKAGDDESAQKYFQAGCDTGHGVSCHNVAALIMNGDAKMDHAVLTRARSRACEAGEKDDCGPVSVAHAPAGGTTDAAPGSAIPGATLNVSSMTADGVVVEDMSCRVDGLGLLGAVVIVGTVAKQKGALRACGVSAPVPVTWTIKGGSVVSATASTGNAKKDACIVAALKQIHSTSDGPCAAKIGLKP